MRDHDLIRSIAPAITSIDVDLDAGNDEQVSDLVETMRRSFQQRVADLARQSDGSPESQG